MTTAIEPLGNLTPAEATRAAVLPPRNDGPGISTQNTVLDTAPLSAQLPRVEGKVMMVGDVWVTDVPVARHRAGAGQVEAPTDGSVNLLEAVIRTSATRAYQRIFENCSPLEQFVGGA